MTLSCRWISAGAGMAAMAALFSDSTLTVAEASTAAPKNYRQGVAAKLRQLDDVAQLRDVKITRPHERFIGLILGGTRTVVCVSAMRPGLFGNPVPAYYVFYFRDGGTDGYMQTSQQALRGCPGEQFAPFAEATRKR